MPFYLYQHPKTGEQIEVMQSMKDNHVYEDEKGLKWERVWSIPQASIDTNINPWDKNAFREKTSTGKKGSMGDLWDRSKELSDKRAHQNGGVDPIRANYEKDYSSKRKGKKKLGR